MSSLRDVIAVLAEKFAHGVLDAVRNASVEEILGELAGRGGAAPTRGPGRPRKVVAVAEEVSVAAPKRGRGRLPRRSPADIGKMVDAIVTTLRANPKGLRSEELRKKLGVGANEIARPILEALDAKRITKTGEKRATTYFASGAPAAPAASKGGAGGAAPKKRGRPAKKAASGGKKASPPAKKSASSKKGAKASAGANGAGGGSSGAEAKANEAAS